MCFHSGYVSASASAWLQVFNTFCDVAQFLLQSPQLPFYDYFGRASCLVPPKRSCKSNFLKFLLRHAHTHIEREGEGGRKGVKERGRHARSGNALPARHSTAFENQYDCDYAALAGAVCVGVYVCVGVSLSLCVCVQMMRRVLRAYSNLQIARAVSKKSLRLVATHSNGKRQAACGQTFCRPALPLILPCSCPT